MATHLRTGQYGEDLAAAFFIGRGYSLLHRNWRHGHCEIDLIALKAGKLHFVEVKTRKSLRYGHPEASVTPAKLRKIMKAADEFLHHHPQYTKVQYDVLAITQLPGKPVEYFLVEDVYI
jgi:putative endonuclease